MEKVNEPYIEKDNGESYWKIEKDNGKQKSIMENRKG